MNTTNNPADIIGFIVAIVTYIASKEIAEVVSPYIAIVVAATMAAGWALSRAGELTGYQSLKFIVLRVGTAILFAVTLANLIALVAPWAAPRWTMVPIAFIIGLVKDVEELKEYKDGLISWLKGGKKDA